MIELEAIRQTHQNLKSKLRKRRISGKEEENLEVPEINKNFKKFVFNSLLEDDLEIPIDVSDLELHIIEKLKEQTEEGNKERIQQSLITLLEELEYKHAILHIDTLVVSEKTRRMIGKLDRNKLRILFEMMFGNYVPCHVGFSRKRRKLKDGDIDTQTLMEETNKLLKTESLEQILSKPSTREKQNQMKSTEFLDIIAKQSWKESKVAETFKSNDKHFRHYCQYGTKEECRTAHNRPRACQQIHFRRIIKPHTDPTLGDCSYLDTCRHMKTCKYVHYEIDLTEEDIKAKTKKGEHDGPRQLTEPQWIFCDIRSFDLTRLGKFSIIMADPPWDIHMELPYGTMKDDEMKNLNIAALQDSGYIFLWVTGRAMELGRECLEIWGYERVDELVWIKTNQLQRIIRTGRTGHWLNHSKEHCLVGKKGSPAIDNMHIDCDVILAEVRETSRKPDEIYGIIERLSPGTRKIELFGRAHNRRPGWLTLGNQLPAIHVVDKEIKLDLDSDLNNSNENESKS